MTDDLRRDLRDLPPSMDLPGDFYDRVISKARRRRRIVRSASTGFAAAVIAAIVVGGSTLTSASSVDRIVPTMPSPAPSVVVPTPEPEPSESPSPSMTPSPSSPPVTTPATQTPATSAPAVVVDYPPLSYANLPYPGCPSGYDSYGNPGSGSQLCVPPGYVPQKTNDCPVGSHWSMGPVICASDSAPFKLVAPISSPGLPSLLFSSLPAPSCQNGYLPTGTLATAGGPLHCAPAAYLPRARYACPSGSILGSAPALCFTSEQKDTIVAPVATY